MKAIIKTNCKIIITQATIAPALARFVSILPMLELASQLAAGKSPRWKDGAKIFSTMEQLSRHLAMLNGVSRSTIWMWYRRFLREGYLGLRRSSRADQGRSRFFALHFRSAELVIEMSTQQRRSAFSIHNELLRSGEDAPSYNTTREFVNSLRRVKRKTR